MYILREPDGTSHQFEFENIVDIGNCINAIKMIRDVHYSYKKDRQGYILKELQDKFNKELLEILPLSSNMECLSKTVKKFNKVSTPITDY